MFLGLAGFLHAQTMTVHVSGTVTADSTGAPVANHEVVIHSDSSSGFIFYTTRQTNPNGFYDCTVEHVPTANPVIFYVATRDCQNNLIIHDFLSTSSPATVNFVICVTPECHAAYTVHHSLDSVHLVHFTDASTSSASIVAWMWNFGDPASGASNTSTVQNPVHIFTAAGTYSVCLSIATSNGCTSIKCDSIEVGIPPPANCENHLTYTGALLTLTFNGTTNSPYPTTYTWQMGDPSGTILTGQSITFTYPAAGPYTVTLVTIDSANCQWSRTQEIYAHATCDVNGHVFMGIHMVDHGWIDLIKVDSNNIMTVVQGKEFGDSTGSFHFGGVAAGNYYLKAELLPASTRYGHFMPTYYEESLSWQSAQLIVLGQPQNPYNIHLVECTPAAPGNGNIQGRITQGGIKFSGNGAGIADIEVMLLDQDNHPFGYTKTDTGGNFIFANLVYGTYNVRPEKAGAASSGAQTTIDNNRPNVTLPFTLSNGQILYGINDPGVNISYISELFPNPASGQKVSFRVNCSREMNINIKLFNALGQTMIQSEAMLESGANTVEINLSGLRIGPYYLKIKTADDKIIIRKLTILGETR